VLERFAFSSDDELFDAVGRGRIEPAQVLEVVFPGLKASERDAATARRRIEDGKDSRLYVHGSGIPSGASVRFAECCSPVPGDRIVGIVEPKKVLAVHTIDCPTLADLDEEDNRWRDLRWSLEAERNTFSEARLHATVRDAPGVLGQACTIIGEAGGNIVNLTMHHRQKNFFDVDFDVEVKDARHLTHIAAALRACPEVETVDRAKG